MALDFVAIFGALLFVAYLGVSLNEWSPLFVLVLAGEASVLVPVASPRDAAAAALEGVGT